MATTHFTEKSLEKLDKGDWIDERYPGLVFRVGQKTRTWMHRQPRRADGSRPGFRLGRHPDLLLDDAVRKYQIERGRLARGEPHPDLDKRIRELEAELRALKRAAGKLVTFGDLVEDFLEHYVPASGRPLSPKVHGRYRRALAAKALPLWKDTDVEQIEAAEIERLVRKIKKKAPHASNEILKILKTMFGWGVQKDIISVNPCAKISKLVQDTKRTRVLSPDELKAAWKSFSAIETRHGDALRFLLLTGQRRAEVCRLPWSEIQEDWWSLRAARTKKSKPNLIYIAPLAQRLLEKLRAETPDSDYVFRGYRNEDKPLCMEHVSKLCKATCDALRDAGDVKRRFTVHDLRRTVATTTRSLGANRRVVKRILNHASNSVTDVYDLYGMKPEIENTLTTWNDYLADLLEIKPSDV